MAITEKYVRSGSVGGGDGTTNADSGANAAYTWAEMITDSGTATDTRYNLMNDADYTGLTASTFGNGNSANPNTLRGCNTALGDLDTVSEDLMSGVLDVTDFPSLTFSSGGLTHTSYSQIHNLDISGAPNGGVVVHASRCVTAHCRVENTNASGGSAYAIEVGTTYSAVFACEAISNSTNAAAHCIPCDRGYVGYSRLTCGSAASCWEPGLIAMCERTAFVGGKNGCKSAGNLAVVTNCSFQNLTGDIFVQSGCVWVIANCVAYGPGGAIKWFNRSSDGPNFQWNNAQGNFAASTGEGEFIKVNEITLTGNPFTSSSDMTLNDTAGAGADCQDEAFGPNLDLGAAQTAGGGGGGGGAEIIGSPIIRSAD